MSFSKFIRENSKMVTSNFLNLRKVFDPDSKKGSKNIWMSISLDTVFRLKIYLILVFLCLHESEKAQFFSF